MSKKLFTQEEQERLKQNKYVKNVTDKGITYTSEFRKEYTILLVKGGKKKEIFSQLGFDTNILGEERMQSFHSRMKRNLKNNKSMEDARTTNSGRKKKSEPDETTESEQIELLKHENVLLKAENELLKKMEFLVMRKTLQNLQQKKDTK